MELERAIRRKMAAGRGFFARGIQRLLRLLRLLMAFKRYAVFPYLCFT